MNFQIDVTSVPPPAPGDAPTVNPTVPETIELLRQMLEVQREQLTYQRAAAAAHDMTARWRAYLSRWQQEFPDLADGCRKVLPLLERSYGRLISELTEKLSEYNDPLDNDFALQEFL